MLELDEDFSTQDAIHVLERLVKEYPDNPRYKKELEALLTVEQNKELAAEQALEDTFGTG